MIIFAHVFLCSSHHEMILYCEHIKYLVYIDNKLFLIHHESITLLVLFKWSYFLHLCISCWGPTCAVGHFPEIQTGRRLRLRRRPHSKVFLMSLIVSFTPFNKTHAVPVKKHTPNVVHVLNMSSSAGTTIK